MHPDADALFDLPPDDFVAERDALAKRLRSQGEREAAKEVSTLRRPTVAAWAVNRVARDEAELLEAVADAGADLRHAQRRALSGIRDAGLGDAARARRAAVDAATSAAVRRAGSESHAAEIAATFEAAAAAADLAEEVGLGRLTRPLPPPDAFGTVTGLSLVTGPEPEADDGEAARAREADEARAAADAAVEQARRAHESAMDAARRAAVERSAREREAREAAEEVQRIAGEVERLKASLEAAEQAAGAAQVEVARAEDAAADADLAVRKRLAALEAAERARAPLEPG